MPAVTAAELEGFMADAFPHTELSWTIDSVTDDGCVVTCPVAHHQSRPGGTLSGPALMGFADGAAYVAVLSRIGLEALAVTTNLNINFLRRPPLETVRVEAHILKVGRTMAVIETTLVTVGDPEPIAHAVVTYSLALTSLAPADDLEQP